MKVYLVVNQSTKTLVTAHVINITTTGLEICMKHMAPTALAVVPCVLAVVPCVSVRYKNDIFLIKVPPYN